MGCRFKSYAGYKRLARLYEYQAKEILSRSGIRIPKGFVINSLEELESKLDDLEPPVVLKAQVWLTGRKDLNGIRFANTKDEVIREAKDLLGIKLKKFTVEKVLIEERITIKQECFAGLMIDDGRKRPLLIFSAAGGTGIEERGGRTILIDPSTGLEKHKVVGLLKEGGLTGKTLIRTADLVSKLYPIMKRYDARSLEVNPIAITDEGIAIALDCHMAIDDYAVYRHPELKIEVAREFDRPPTELERIAYKVESKDYRGTFYFFQVVEDVPADGAYIGFHGAGGGGSMFSMDAVTAQGYQIANFCDTSGNPPASKVYRAARIILSQPNISGYFASGSGVASQEQVQSARGLVKAFLEENLSIPAVIRLGGNMEEEAVRILKTYLTDIPAPVEGYGKDDPPDLCALRLKELIRPGTIHQVSRFTLPEPFPYRFETFSGLISIDHQRCRNCQSRGCIEACRYQILKLEDQRPVLAQDPAAVKKGRCPECLACELFCRFHEQDAIRIILPIPGLEAYRQRLSDGDHHRQG
ncbi:MAG TPA: hypothetical protein EYP24_04030 [bacterium (Candidatus Stahlbacteria)]|nr:hypothetical protein [Candidatus Stahlbacteria bacterium]